jgi:hypothetical protein
MRVVIALIVLMGCGDRGISAGERGRLLAMRPVWVAAAKAERCLRPALRAPVTGDGAIRLHALIDKSSPERKCLARVKELRDELGPCLPQQRCGPQTLSTLKPHTDVVEACAPLYAAIEELAHTSEACSPTPDMRWQDFDEVDLFGPLGNAIRLEVAPHVANGQLGQASRHVLDAMRFADDLGRKGTLVGAMLSTWVMSRLVDTLDELATDPRLTTDDARAIARDLDVLLASAPRWDTIMRQEQAWVADFAASHSEDMVPELAILEARARGIKRVCSGTLRDCVDHLDDVQVGQGIDFKPYARRFGMRDGGLAFVRMQVELRLTTPEVCADPIRRRALLQPWAERAVVGDGREPVVTPPAWQLDPQDQLRLKPRTLRCVHATI